MHVPVLQKEVIDYLDPKPNDNFIDCTIDGGGHALVILEKTGPNGKILGIDWDKKVISNLKSKIANLELKNRLILTCDNFANLKEIVKEENFESISGVLFDLGLSSWHLEESERGFSFQKDEPLDMRYDKGEKLTAEKILNEYSRREIEKILKEYGEEMFAERIAQNIVDFRKSEPVKNTFQLVEIIKKSVPYWYQRQRRHFATKTFQALRIAVNDEIRNLEKALPQALEAILPEGRLVFISFHSLEDRIVKNFFREKAKEGNLKIITKKPIHPSWTEIKKNPRSRSAKLRAAIKIN
ncbi:MAG: 16S rRNA (cytosine(1402)-N(4))-methyltransferase RsmH [bacterium]|nr:16S rRNA (cytosine(1402)-N(4))-methyltransferase RsmH [bacterium]